VGDEHHVRAVEVAAFEQGDLAAAHGAALLVGCSDDDDSAGVSFMTLARPVAASRPDVAIRLWPQACPLARASYSSIR
jgi:hypothetical protein